MTDGRDRRWSGPPGPNPEWRGRRGQFVRRVGCLFLVVAFSLFLLGGVTWRLLFGRSGEEQGPPTHALFLLIPLGLIMWMIIRGLRRTAEPIGSVMEAADRVAEGDYTVRVEPHGSPPVRGLMFAFNAMTNRLQANEEQRRMLLADIAHELRNPLAIIRGNVEGMIDGVYPRDDGQLAPLLEETTQMARLLDDLQTLSSVEAGALQLDREPVCLASFISDVTNAFRPRAEAAGITLEESTAGDGELSIDPSPDPAGNREPDPERAPPHPGGWSCSGACLPGARPRNHRGIRQRRRHPGRCSAEHLRPLCEVSRFRRLGAWSGDRQALVERHGGTVVATSQIGQGTTIRVTLPVKSG